MPPEEFSISIPNTVLHDLRRRLDAVTWPDDHDNEDWKYGANVAYLREVAETWRRDYDWRETERAINGFRHYRVSIDGMPVHYIREPGRGPRPIPLILTHGWPWTFWDMQKVIRPLADPAAFGGDPADAFEVIVPSLPGFGFSTPLPRAGMNFWLTAELWQKLMTEVLGFPRYAAAGGDWGALVTEQLGHKYAASLYGAHIIQTIPMHVFSGDQYWDLIAGRGGLPADMPAEKRRATIAYFKPKLVHVAVHMLEPESLAIALHDSPVGLLGWLLKRRRDWGQTGGDVESVFPRRHLLDTATLYWVSRSFVSSARYYADAARFPWQPAHDRSPVVQAPTGITFLGGENPPGVTTQTRLDAFRASPLAGYYNVHYLAAHAQGGHFGHYENPEACIADIRATFRGLR